MKPDLPSVKGAAWLKEYKPSGVCPPIITVLMLGLGALAGAVIGVIGYYGGFLTSGLAQLGFIYLGEFFGLLSAAIYGVGVIGFIGLGYPGLLGFCLGCFIWLLAKTGKCRNSGLTAGIGFLCGTIAYGVFAWMAIHFDGVHETSYLTKLLPSLSSTSGWMILFVVVDAFILVGATTATSWTVIHDNPFCEECNEWYRKPVKVICSLELATPLVRTLESGTPQDLEKVLRLPSGAPRTAWIELKMRRCPCSHADYELSTMLYWQEIKVEKRERKIEEKSEVWFQTMITASLGRQLETALFATPAPVELKAP